MKCVFTLCLFLCLVSVRSFSNPFVANSSNYDVVYHRISISVDPTGGSRAITNGSVTTYFKTTTANVNSLQFDLDGNMTVSSATYHGSGITKSHNTSTDVLTLTIPNIAVAGTLDSVTVFYSGSPATPTTSIPSGYNVKSHNGGTQWEIYTLDEAYTAHYWWPCKETLYDKIDSVDLIVTTPSGYKVAGNGVVTENVVGPNRITTWSTGYSIATYGINFAVANFQNYQFNLTTGGKTYPVMNYFFPEDNTTAYHGYADQLKNIIPAFVNVLNVNYPFADEKYGLAECTGNWGALEVQSMTFMAQSSYNDNGYTIAHEAAHQWFGDMVTTNSWQQVWLNEGFATYFEKYVYPELLRPADLQGKRDGNKAAITTTSRVFVTDTSSADRIFFGNGTPAAQPYEKGGMLLSMLRTWVGDAGFFNGLHDYLTAPKIQYGFGAVDSLQKYMQTYTPFNLTNFFADWVNKPGYAKYDVSWSNVNKRIYIRLQQTPTSAGAGYFDMPVPIRITGSGLDTTVIIIDRRGVLYNSATGSTTGLNTIGFNLSAVPTAISFDPKNLVMATASSVTVNTALPLYDVSLQAIKANSKVNIDWKIKTEENVKMVTVEKSYDGIHFTTYKTFASPVSSNNQITGSCTDEVPRGFLGYRLKIGKPDGSYFYSIIQTISGNATAKTEVVPNPVYNDFTISLPDVLVDENVQVLIQNANGQVIKQIEAKGNGSVIRLQSEGLASGTYWATIITKNKEYGRVSFIKQ